VSFEAVDGVATYPKAPTTSDRADERGGPNRATRVESVTYVFEHPGAVTLPDVTVRWWDEAQQRVRTATLQALSLTIAAASTTSSIAFADDEAVARQRAVEARAERRRRERALAAAVALLVGVAVIAWLWRRFGDRLRHAATAGWHLARTSEPVYFRRVTRASRAGDPHAAYLACLVWLDRIWIEDGTPMTLERAAEMSGDRAFGDESRALAARLFGDPRAPRKPWGGTDFARAVTNVRPRLLRLARGSARADVSALPPLNPTDAKIRLRASNGRVSS